MEVEKTVISRLSYLASDLGFVTNTMNVLFQMYCSKKMYCILGFASNSAGKEPACKAGVLFLGWEDSLEKG